MRSFPTDIEKNLQFSGHETFPLRQLWLRKAYDAVAAFTPVAPRRLFADEDAIVRFGVGKNMVASMRHWSLACDVIADVDGGYRATELGNLIFGTPGLDPYSEQPATTWLIHWMLAGRGCRSTTCWWVFNCIVRQTFDREWLFTEMKAYAKERQLRIADNTLKRDIDVCIRSYIPRLSHESHEEIAEPVLGELGLLQQGSRETFEFRRGPKHTLPDGVFAFALLEFWERHSPSTKTLSFDSIAHEYGSPGRVFKLDENAVADRVMNLDGLTRGALQWSDTAGLRQVIHYSDRLDKYELLRKAYS